MINHSKQEGLKIELFVKDYLEQQGLTLVTSNFHSRFGEIDLIMKDKEDLVFVEVRYRSNALFGSAAESVNYSKQQKIIKTAQFYLLNEKKYQQLNCRFDVVSVTLHHQELQATWYQHAFLTQEH